MPQITFLPGNQICDAESGTPLQTVAERAGVAISYPCAGKGVCGKCLVKVERGGVEFDDNGKIPSAMRARGFVLACRSKVADDAVILVSSLSEERGKFSDDLSHLAVDEALFPQPDDIKPLVTAERITVARPEHGDGLGDYDRFIHAARNHFSAGSIYLPLGVLRKLPDALRQNDGEIFVWHAKVQDTIHIVDITPKRPGSDYGPSFDLSVVKGNRVDHFSFRDIDELYRDGGRADVDRDAVIGYGR